ncbi:hypothetical protein CNMCM5793_006414 [Aspergillus hiratsukae]|uniref:Nephrocystin 3-like N-terminal domain-containing protein n=1 Tax=Aspergillus hiratsukae TaxID=1194566 RepID=A0A8H6UJU6_9EURO|nr:hypothetical protein CNMCM5793_006414 [Aspergillus hiratsukae]
MPNTNDARLTHDDYTVAWICPLEVEQIAAIRMLDSEHERLPQPPNDHNVYTLGSINGHNVVIAGLHSPGNNPAAVVVTQMRNTFQQLRFGVLVGIGGGVPTRTERGDIHLGHVVVSKPVGEHSGVVQYDRGKAEVGQFRHTGYLAPPPTVLLNAAREMDVRRAMMREDPLLNHIARIDTAIPGLRRYKYPGADKDHLYRAEYLHPDPNVACRKCGCDSSQIVDRRAEDSDDDDDDVYDQGQQLVVHRGTIAAGELVIKHGVLRDELARQYSILCFEMEAAGALADFPCLVIRGISDYSDSHKNDRWQGYAAAAAAAYARELFFHMPIDEVKKCKIAEHVDVKQMITQVDGLAQDNQSRKIYDWLKPPDPSTNLNEAQKKRHEGTGTWFLQSEPFKEWKAGKRRYVWLHGIPGCGKTVLSATIIEHLNQQLDSSHVVLDFFFDFTDTNKQSLDTLVRSLVAQLYSRCENSRKELDKLFSSCEYGRQQPTHESLLDTFQHMVNHVEKIQIVIDALDECKTRRDLLLWMERLARSGHPGLDLLATSRREEDIESELKRWMHRGNLLSIQQDPVNHDIRAYVHERLRNNNGGFERWHSEQSVQDEIETELMKKADGMFRWAACQLDILQKCLDLRMLRDSLRSLPKTLEETYAQILASIDETYRQEIKAQFPLAQYSARYWMDHAVPAETEKDVQKSILNFFLQQGQAYAVWGMLFHPERPWEEEPSHNEMASPLYYASFAGLRRTIELLLEKGADVNAQGGLYGNALQAACVEGHKEVVQLLLENGAEVNVQDGGYYGNALHAACVEGHKEVAQLLLENGAEVNAKGGEYGNALQAASAQGDNEVVQLLLENGAEVNAKGGVYGNALQAACDLGNKQVVQLLLEKGAEVNAKGGVYGNALQAACIVGDKEVVQLLLEKGADVNTQGGRYYSNALQAASVRDDKEVVQLLLDKGAEVNVKGGEYGYTLLTACYLGHKQIVQLLLEKGADVNAQGGEYGNALQAACREGYKEVVRLLIEKGAEVDAQAGGVQQRSQIVSVEGQRARHVPESIARS